MTQSTIASYTPGPWRWEIPDDSPVAVIRQGTNVEIGSVYWGDGYVSGRVNPPIEETEANARLISAAPDGLEAAQFALSVLQANPIELSERMAIEKLEAFIAKATGVEP